MRECVHVCVRQLNIDIYRFASGSLYFWKSEVILRKLFSQKKKKKTKGKKKKKSLLTMKIAMKPGAVGGASCVCRHAVNERASVHPAVPTVAIFGHLFPGRAVRCGAGTCIGNR